MRIAIITQPLISNYGGLIQNWALQKILRQQFPAADVITFDQVDSIAPLFLRVGSAIKRYITGKKVVTTKDKFDLFREKHINSTSKAQSLRDFKKFDHLFKPDVYIVGSDQVWRPSMVHNLNANFLSFTHCKKKIAYAASFGIDSWEFTPKETASCRRLIHEFTAVSVREQAGINLCLEKFGCIAEHVLDPTLLLHSADYDTLLSEESESNKNYAFTYILDTDYSKQHIVQELIGSLPELNAAHNTKGNMPTVRPSVEAWLMGIKNARIVICDSFHGVAFSIIFNKDFYVLGNPQRGNSRISSVLAQFGLSDRLVESLNAARALPPIDWNKVNNLREHLISYSLSFLHSAL